MKVTVFGIGYVGLVQAAVQLKLAMTLCALMLMSEKSKT